MSDTKIKTSNIGNLAVTHALLHTDMDLTSKTVQVATPTSNTHPATKAYVDTEVANLIDSAPGTLDTLNELAAAINDDANFNATIASSIATKLPLAGGTLTGNLTLASTASGSSASPELELRRDITGVDANYLGQIKFTADNDADQNVVFAKITGKILDASDGTEDGIIEFAHQKAGSNNISARFRSDSLQLINGTNLTVAGTTELTGNLTVDTNTLYVDTSNNRVGIGTSSPGSILTVQGTLGDGSSEAYIDGWSIIGNRYQGNTMTKLNWAGGGARIQGFNSGVQKFEVSANSSTYFIGGNVGIGETNPGFKLDVLTASADGIRTTSASQTVIRLDTTNPDAAARNWQMAISSVAHGDFNLTTSTTNGGDPINATSRLYINASGNVGIGTESPSYKLDVYNNTTDTGSQLRVKNAHTAVGADAVVNIDGYGASTLKLWRNGVEEWKLERISNTDNLGLYAYGGAVSNGAGAGLIQFWDYDSGNVGIGTDLPSEKLEVSGNILANAFFRQNENYPTVKPTLGICSQSKSIDSRLEFTRGDPGQYGATLVTYVGHDGLIHYAKPDEPRFTHDPLTGECLGLLMEKATTNYMTRTMFGDGWSSGASGTQLVFDTGTTAPDGQKGCYRWQLGTNAGYHRLSRDVTLPSATGTYAISVWAKKVATVGMGRYFEIEISGNFANHCSVTFDLEDGVHQVNTNNTGITNVIMEEYPNGWYRCGFGFSNPGQTFGRIWFGVPTSIGNDTSVTGDGGVAWAIWGPQVEDYTYGGTDGFVTSYIPTGQDPQTRARDIVNINNLDGILNHGEFTHSIFVDFTNLKNPPAGHTNFGIWQVDGSAGTYALLRLDNGGPGAIVQQHHNGSSYPGSGGGSSQPGDRMRIASRFEDQNFKTYENGVAFGTSTGSINSNWTHWETAVIGGTGQYMGLGVIKTFQIYNKALTNDELALLTRTEKSS
jgi:hypothetical protein